MRAKKFACKPREQGDNRRMCLGCEPHQEHVYKRRYGRLAARRGKKRALVATAHELLTIVYHVLKDQVVYSELGCGYVDQRRKNARIKYHLDVLKNLGVDIPEPSPVSA